MNDLSARLGLATRIALNGLLDLVFPPRCTCCGRSGDWICQNCFQAFLRIGEHCCARCGNPAGRGATCRLCDSDDWALDRVRGAALAEGPLLDAIHSFKYRGVSVLAPRLVGLLAEQVGGFPSIDVLVPVPLHAARQRHRGYNQSVLLARELSKLTQLPVCTDQLIRARNTRPQVGLDLVERHHNVEAAFDVGGDTLAGRRVLLIDDVCTTGATLNSAARVLHAHGVTAVSAMVLARPRLPHDRNAIDSPV